MKNKIKTITLVGIFTTLALILAYVELLIPPLFPALPGIKMGLPNIIIVFLLYRKNAASAILVSILRIMLVTLLFSNLVTFIYSLAGAVLSLLVMILLRRLNLLSVVGVSITGAVAHNIGQIIAAMLLLDSSELSYYLIVLIFSGIIAGIFVGLCGSVLIKKFPTKLSFFDK